VVILVGEENEGVLLERRRCRKVIITQVRLGFVLVMNENIAKAVFDEKRQLRAWVLSHARRIQDDSVAIK